MAALFTILALGAIGLFPVDLRIKLLNFDLSRQAEACCGWWIFPDIDIETYIEPTGSPEDNTIQYICSFTNISNGNFLIQNSTPAIPGVGRPIQIVATYNSRYETTNIPIKGNINLGSLTSFDRIDWNVDIEGHTYSGSGLNIYTIWDTTDGQGNLVPAGTYTYVISATIYSFGTAYSASGTGTVDVKRGYDGSIGYNWTHNYNIFLKENTDGSITLVDEMGTWKNFTSNWWGFYSPPPGDYSALTKNWYLLNNSG